MEASTRVDQLYDVIKVWTAPKIEWEYLRTNTQEATEQTLDANPNFISSSMAAFVALLASLRKRLRFAIVL